MEAKPYVYRLTHPVTGEFYIGSRTANKVCAELDLPKYRTSSKYIKPRFDEFDWAILMEFSNPSCAYDYEQYMIHETWSDPLLLNKSCHYQNKKRFHPLGIKHSEAVREANRQRKLGNKNRLGKPFSEEVREQIRQKLIGYKHTDEARKNMSASRIGNTNGSALKGKKKPDGHANNVRQANIGLRFFNNGIITVRTRDCPDGFVPGMIRKSNRNNIKLEGKA
jgi:hypothetical protein